MNYKSFSLILFFIFYSLFTFSGCSYKPSSYYAKKSISGNVFVDLDVDIDNTENSVLIKDAMNEMLLSQLQSTLVTQKSKADVLIFIKLNNVSHSVLQTDNEGYTLSYRTNVTVSIEYKKNKLNSKLTTLQLSNYSDYEVDEDSIITEQRKQKAIKLASAKVFSNLVSKIAIRNLSNSSNK